jgi:anti-sigma factor RsiW
MTCKKTRRLFSRHLDGRTSDAERAEIEAHLPGCAGCRAELARFDVPARALRAIGPAPVPEGLAERSWRAAIAARHRSSSFADGFVWAAQRAAAAGAVAAALVWGGLLLGGSGTAGSAELVAAPDAAEMAVSLWSAVEPGSYPDE